MTLTATAAAVVGLAVGGVAYATNDAGSPPRQDELTIRTLEDGRTLGGIPGPDKDGHVSDEEMPDLIAMYTDDGRIGYVDRHAMNPMPANPEEATRLANEAPKTISYPAYDVDGKTVIGTVTHTRQGGTSTSTDGTTSTTR
jgi:hypothetical protein